METPTARNLIKDPRELIIRAREDVARSVNSSLVMLYWKVAQRIQKEILKEKRAEYGDCRDSVATINGRIWGGVWSEKPLSDDKIC